MQIFVKPKHVGTATLAATLSLVCGVASAAALHKEMIASCMVRAAATLSFSGSIYARLGDVAVEKSFGTADASGRIPISNHTQFNIASAGKMFTAVAIGLLVDRGAVEFDAPISRYLPGLNAEVGAITVAQLLNHTSGLGDYFHASNRAAIDAAMTATDLLPLALASAHEFPAGSKRAYSNSGFVVLGAIIEKVSGLTYAQFVKKEILTPLGMSNTRFDAERGAQAMTLMSPEGQLQKARPAPVQARASPAGGMFSTPSDLSLFLTALNTGQLVKRETVRTLLLGRPDPGGGGSVYGYGFNIRDNAPRRVGHGGGAPGANAEVALYPDSGRQLIALSNYDPPGATRMVTVLEKVLFAADPEPACPTALADPELLAPTPQLHPPVLRKQ
jgi:D-alanyl-D-alanine carboxypeptidase